jgi:hypothetical protein
MGTVLLGIVEGDALLQVREGLGQLAEPEQRHPECHVSF